MKTIMNIKNINGAGFIILNFDNKIKEWKILVLTALDGSYDLPKGAIDKGESLLDAAKRELFEETNIDINSNNVFKTWVNWDIYDENLDFEEVEEISVFSKNKNLIMFFAECSKDLLEEIKILPNPYTNIKEHLNFKLISIKEFESVNTPDYMKPLFRKTLNKILNLGEKRGFYEFNKKGNIK